MNRGRTTLLAASAVALLAGCYPINHRSPEPAGPQTGQVYCKDPDNGIIYSPQSGQCDAGDIVTTSTAFEDYRAQAGTQTATGSDLSPVPPPPATPAQPAPPPIQSAPQQPAQSQPAAQQSAAKEEPELALVAAGTSFFISSDGYLLTNHHVIEGCEEMLVVTTDGDYPARMIDSNQQLDLALLKVQKSGMPFAAFAARLPEAGDSAYAVGYPLVFELGGIKITDGIVSGLSGIAGDETRLQLSVPLQHGNSGGPVLDETGLVIAVVSEKIVAEDVEGVSFAIIPEAAGAFLVHNHVKPTILRSDVVRKVRDIMREAERYTWPALCFARSPV